MAPRKPPAAPPAPEPDAVTDDVADDAGLSQMTEKVRALVAEAMGVEPNQLGDAARQTGLMVVPATMDLAQVRYINFDPPPDQTPPAAVPVHVALARVIADLPGISKDETSPEGYKYRGIEQVTRAAQQCLAKHGVVIYPVAEIINVIEHDQLAMNPGWREYVISVTWHVTGPAGDRLEPCPVTWGQGRDKSDKSINKAMTQAFKYLLLQLLMIGDQKDDTDAGKEPDASEYRDNRGGGRRRNGGAQAEPDRGPDAVIERDTFDRLRGLIASLPAGARDWLVGEWTAETPMGDDDTAFPVDEEGKPALRLLPVALVPAVDSLINRAKTHHRTEQAKAADPTPPTETTAELDTDPGVPPAEVTWSDVIAQVRAMTEDEITAAIRDAGLEPATSPPAAMALVTMHLGKEAGLDIADYRPTTAADPVDETAAEYAADLAADDAAAEEEDDGTGY